MSGRGHGGGIGWVGHGHGAFVAYIARQWASLAASALVSKIPGMGNFADGLLTLADRAKAISGAAREYCQ